MIVPRPDQVEMIEAVRAHMTNGCRSVVLQSPTGTGKTVMGADILRSLVEKGKLGAIVVHRRELIEQTRDTFKDMGIPFGILAAGFPTKHRAPIQICSVQSLARRFKRIRPRDLVLIDEGHHGVSNTYLRIPKEWPKSYLIWLTATPRRLDGKGLGRVAQQIVTGLSIREHIDAGNLCDYILVAPKDDTNMDGVHSLGGDYRKDEAAAAMDRSVLVGATVENYRKHANGKRAILFEISIERSKREAVLLREAGILAVHVDGDTPTGTRLSVMRDFRAGQIHVLCNVDLFGEGVDVPGVDCIIMRRPTSSLTVYLQQVGRGLRTAPGKTHCIIIDHANNYKIHGFPDDDRQWSLDDQVRRSSSGGSDLPVIRARRCPICALVMRYGATNCKYCGHEFVVQGREIDEQEGTLGVIDVEAARRGYIEEVSSAQTVEDLIRIGHKRRLRHPEAWAYEQMKRRQARKLAGKR